jgi:hypothetical protein
MTFHPPLSTSFKGPTTEKGSRPYERQPFEDHVRRRNFIDSVRCLLSGSPGNASSIASQRSPKVVMNRRGNSTIVVDLELLARVVIEIQQI